MTRIKLKSREKKVGVQARISEELFFKAKKMLEADGVSWTALIEGSVRAYTENKIKIEP